MSDGLAYGIYAVLRKMSGYRLEHFWREDFYASQFFVLVSFLQDESSSVNDKNEKDDDVKKEDGPRVGRRRV